MFNHVESPKMVNPQAFDQRCFEDLFVKSSGHRPGPVWQAAGASPGALSQALREEMAIRLWVGFPTWWLIPRLVSGFYNPSD